MNREPSPPPAARSASGTPNPAVRGRLVASHALPLPATFSFESYGARFDAAIRRSEGAGARLVVRCNLGHMPFSAESPTLRRYLHAVIDAGAELPMAEITLDRSQAIILRGSMEFPSQPSPALTAAGTAAIVLTVRSMIEIIEACRAGSAAVRTGAAKPTVN